MDAEALVKGREKLRAAPNIKYNAARPSKKRIESQRLSRAWSIRITQVGLEYEVDEGLKINRNKICALPEMCQQIVEVLKVIKGLTSKNVDELASMTYPPSATLQELRCAVRVLLVFLKRCHDEPVRSRLLSTSVSGTVVASMIECEEALKKLAGDPHTSREFRADLRISARQVAAILKKTKVEELPPALATAVERCVLGLLLLALVQDGVAIDEEDAQNQVSQIVQSQLEEEQAYIDEQEAANLSRLSEECRSISIEEEERQTHTALPNVVCIPEEAEVEIPLGESNIRQDIKTPRDGTAPPQEFICPLTQEVFIEPVLLLTDGRSFEKSAIEKWLAIHPKTDPITQKVYKNPLETVPNRVLAQLVDGWRQGRGSDFNLAYLRLSLRTHNTALDPSASPVSPSVESSKAQSKKKGIARRIAAALTTPGGKAASRRRTLSPRRTPRVKTPPGNSSPSIQQHQTTTPISAPNSAPATIENEERPEFFLTRESSSSLSGIVYPE